MMSKITLLVLLSTACVCAYAQEPDPAREKMMADMKQKMMDSIRSVRIEEAALMYPRLRQLTVTHHNNAEGNIDSRLLGNEFFSGRIRSSRTSLNLNVPVLTQRKNIVVASVGFVHQFIDLSKITNYDSRYVVSQETRNIPMFSLAASYNRRDTLFHIPVSFTASFGGLFSSDFTSKQLRFLGLVTIPVIRRENTNMTIGAALTIDPSALLPVVPIISYSHKWKSIKTDLFVDFPYRVALRKVVTKKNFVTAFSEMTGNNSFFSFNDPSPVLPDRMNFSTVELKSGLMFEHRLTKKAILSLSGGLNTTLRSKLIKVGGKQSDYVIKNKTPATPYIQIGFSLLPFWDPLKRLSLH
jgi:hypothetical protein